MTEETRYSRRYQAQPPDLNRLYNIPYQESERIAKKVVPDMPVPTTQTAPSANRPILKKMGEMPGIGPQIYRKIRGARWVSPYEIGMQPEMAIPSRQIVPTTVPTRNISNVGDIITSDIEGYEPKQYIPTPAAPPIIPESLANKGVIEMGETPQGRPYYRTAEGVLSMEPETGETQAGDITAIEFGIPSRIKQFERGVINEYNNEQQLALESRQRERGTAAMEELEAQREAGIVPLAGMAEYEANVARMRTPVIERPLARKGLEERRGAYVTGKQDVAKERVGVIPAIEKTRRASALEAARLGLSAQDVASKIQLRQAQEDRLFTQSAYKEPMELALKTAKTNMERNKIQRDYKYRALNDEWNGVRDYLKNAYTPFSPEYQEEFKKAYDKFNQRKDLIDIQHPEPGMIMPIHPDVIAKHPELKGKSQIAVETPQGMRWKIYEESQQVIPTK